ncbi:HEAT repeat domain-containing protein [Sphingobacterium anhuiense]|uniref:HEAT repeat domain-containing protein n=1 Tax=Sphingobacterium anhuiense TaxID=493780 RepID=A0ABW5Z161_9SPHI
MYYDYYFYYLSYLSSLYNGYPLIIRMTVFMVMILALLTVFGMLRLAYIGIKIHLREKGKVKTKTHFEEKLMFVMKSKTNYDVEEIQQLLEYDIANTKRWNPEMITDVVLTVKNTVYKQGELNEINYKNCLAVLSLMGFWEKRIRTSGVDRRKVALQIVGDMDNGVNSGVLSKSTFHKNRYIRKTARDLYTSQDTYNPFRFMEENFDEEFTQLDKLRLHATLVKRSISGKLPNLMRWVNSSKNPNYILFILKEIGHFKQYEAAHSLIGFLEKNENRDVRAQVVLTLGELQYHECASDLIARYALESTVVRGAIIKTMGKFVGKTTLAFLVDAYRITEDANTKLLIARSIRNHGHEGDVRLKQLKGEIQNNEREHILLNQVFAEKTMVSR